jgi:hypothetical protein
MQERVFACFLSSTNFLDLEIVTDNALRRFIPVTTNRGRYQSRGDERNTAGSTSWSSDRATLMDIEIKWESPVCSQLNVSKPERRHSDNVQSLLDVSSEDTTPALWHQAIANPVA